MSSGRSRIIIQLIMTPEPKGIVLGPSGKPESKPVSREKAEQAAGFLRQQYESNDFTVIDVKKASLRTKIQSLLARPLPNR